MVALVTRLQLHGHAKPVSVGRHVVGGHGVLQPLHDLPLTRQPARHLADDEGGMLVVGLQEVARVDACGCVLDCRLGVLSAGLKKVRRIRQENDKMMNEEEKGE